MRSATSRRWATAPGFRKIRRELGVTAFGANAIVLPAGIETGSHFHDQQEELYFVHRGHIEMEFGDGSTPRAGPGRARARGRRHRAQSATWATRTPCT